MPALVLVWPKLPWETLVVASAGLLGVGAAAAAHEDTKTIKALYADSPFEAEVNGGTAG
ncbi:hypothetical protein AB0J38_41135 [Streptomyces sp. NPDC050095]|uniref:hypothetical protein n=1 Tax=unclassified Streptomyces TaxID=2593676 RepID=UPI0034225E56